MPLDDIMAAVNALDNSTISLDAIELLQRIEPNAEEIKAYREFSFKKQDPNELTEEDRQDNYNELHPVWFSICFSPGLC